MDYMHIKMYFYIKSMLRSRRHAYTVKYTSPRAQAPSPASATAHEPATQALGPRAQQLRDCCEVVARRVQVVAGEVEAVQREVDTRALELVREHVDALQHLLR